MGMNTATLCLEPAEEIYMQALLWEEGHLLQGPATRAAQVHGLSLLRCLEAANRLSPNLHGEALNRLVRDDPTLKTHTDDETKDTIISGMGDA